MDVPGIVTAPGAGAPLAFVPSAQAAPTGAFGATDTTATPAAEPDSVPVPAPQASDAPAPTPAVEQADLRNLPLAVKYAPSSPPRDGERAPTVDRFA